MVVTRLRLRDFRSYAAAEVGLGERLTVVHGPNGAGKTNLLEALYFGCTGRSCRTTNERELRALRRRARRRRARGGPRARPRRRARAQRRLPARARPSASRSTARRPSGCSTRRTARWSASSCPIAWSSSRARRRCAARTSTRSSARCGRGATATRRQYAQALAQRNALLARVRAGGLALGAGGLGPRARAPRHRPARRPRRRRWTSCARASPRPPRELGLAGAAELRYRPRSRAETAEALAAELAERLDADLERGFTTHGPHRDDVAPAARRARAARLRLAGRAADGPARAAARRARGPRGGARGAAAAAPRRRHERARLRPPRAARRAPARRAGAGDDDRRRARARAPTRTTSCACASRTASSTARSRVPA